MTTDVWARTTEIDDSALRVMAARLENRAKHPFFRGVIADYIDDLDLQQIGSVLEIGCGTGVVSRRLAATAGFSGSIIATDVSPYLIEAARRHATAEGVSRRIVFEVGSATKLQGASNSCDLVIAHTLLSHAAEPAAVLAECARVLRPHGRLLIFDRDFASSALSIDSDIAAKIDFTDLTRAMAAQPFIMRQLPALLPRAGFSIDSSRSYVIADVGHAEFFVENLSTWRQLLPISGIVRQGDTDLLMDRLQAASDAGTLFWANNFYTFVARKAA